MGHGRERYSTLNILYQSPVFDLISFLVVYSFSMYKKFGVSRAFHSGSHAICCCSDLFLTSSSYRLPPHWFLLTSCAQSTIIKQSSYFPEQHHAGLFFLFCFSRIVPTLFISRAESLSTWTGVLDSSCYTIYFNLCLN